MKKYKIGFSPHINVRSIPNSSSICYKLYSLEENEQILQNTRVRKTFLNWAQSTDTIWNPTDKFQFQFRNSIEHFYPQNPPNGVRRWEDDKGEPLEALNCFGNLALITVSGNSKFLNFIPKDKVEYWKDIKKQSPKLQIMSEKANDWSEEVAKKHGDEMLKLLEKEIKDKLKI